MRFTIYALLSAAAAALSSAYTQPVGSPSGNAITRPGLAEIVPAGTPYTITWTPSTSTSGTVTLLLLRGPSTNIAVLYPIVEGILNTGSYTWTPSTALQPDTTGYGIQLIVDATGQYQYTAQFGISNPSYSGSNSTASAGFPTNSANSTSFVTITATSTSSSASTITVVGTAPASANSTFIIPTLTASLTVPSSLLTTATYAPVATAATYPTYTTAAAVASVPASVSTNAGVVRAASGASALLVAVGAMFAMLL